MHLLAGTLPWSLSTMLSCVPQKAIIGGMAALMWFSKVTSMSFLGLNHLFATGGEPYRIEPADTTADTRPLVHSDVSYSLESLGSFKPGFVVANKPRDIHDPPAEPPPEIMRFGSKTNSPSLAAFCLYHRIALLASVIQMAFTLTQPVICRGGDDDPASMIFTPREIGTARTRTSSGK